jgi:hypothetical protein
MKMRKLKAIRSHKYGTRHLTAGDEYEAPPRHAVALVAARRAQFADKVPARARAAEAKAEVAVEEQAAAQAETMAPPQPEPEPAAEQVPSLDSLRLQATQLGINVDGRWGVARLQHEIEQARQR